MDEAKRKGFDVVDLHKEKASRTEFEGRVKKLNPSFVLLNGHGNEQSVTGHDNKPLVTRGENEELLHNRITYAVSCDSAAVLGAEVVRHGRSTYIGYTKNFVFNLNLSYLSEPTRDTRAAQFLDASNQVPFSLLKGHTAKEASERSKSAFRRALRALLPSFTSDPQAREDAKDLYWNMIHQVCLGEENAKI